MSLPLSTPEGLADNCTAVSLNQPYLGGLLPVNIKPLILAHGSLYILRFYSHSTSKPERERESAAQAVPMDSSSKI